MVESGRVMSGVGANHVVATCTCAFTLAEAAGKNTKLHPLPGRRLARHQERQRVKEAAAFCADSLSDGWQEAVAARITDYAESTWERLKPLPDRRRNCKALAQIARSILKTRTQIHSVVGHAHRLGW